MTIENIAQFESMKKIGLIVANCLAYTRSKARPGMSTKELDHLSSTYLSEKAAISAPKDIYNFPGATCISVEREAAHGIPSKYTILKKGDLINIDVSAKFEGFYADNGESFVLGKGAKIKHSLCRTVDSILTNVISKVHPEFQLGMIGKNVENEAKKNGFTVIKNLGGHGVGNSLHENPKFIPSYYNGDKRCLKENMVVAIEPFISNGGTEVKEAKDGWTLFQKHFYSAQKEHTIMITKNKPYIFTNPNRSFS